MSQEQINNNQTFAELKDLVDKEQLKNDTQWKKRVNLFRLVYAFLITNNSQDEIIENSEDDLINTEHFEQQKEILNDVILHYEQYKQLIEQHLKNWSFDRISCVDKAIFLSAIAEQNVLETDKKILIDQSVITAKRYSNPNAYRYINAILDKVLH